MDSTTDEPPSRASGSAGKRVKKTIEQLRETDRLRQRRFRARRKEMLLKSKLGLESDPTGSENDGFQPQDHKNPPEQLPKSEVRRMKDRERKRRERARRKDRQMRELSDGTIELDSSFEQLASDSGEQIKQEPEPSTEIPDESSIFTNMLVNIFGAAAAVADQPSDLSGLVKEEPIEVPPVPEPQPMIRVKREPKPFPMNMLIDVKDEPEPEVLEDEEFDFMKNFMQFQQNPQYTPQGNEEFHEHVPMDSDSEEEVVLPSEPNERRRVQDRIRKRRERKRKRIAGYIEAGLDPQMAYDRFRARRAESKMNRQKKEEIVSIMQNDVDAEELEDEAQNGYEFEEAYQQPFIDDEPIDKNKECTFEDMMKIVNLVLAPNRPSVSRQPPIIDESQKEHRREMDRIRKRAWRAKRKAQQTVDTFVEQHAEEEPPSKRETPLPEPLLKSFSHRSKAEKNQAHKIYNRRYRERLKVRQELGLDDEPPEDGRRRTLTLVEIRRKDRERKRAYRERKRMELGSE